MVRRRALAVAGATTAGALLLGVAGDPAGATSRKVAIGDFRWSPPEVSVDLGDTVTWTWVGPDRQHSVTGVSPNAAGIDSDAGRTPDHRAGDRFAVRFTAPGAYDFQCRLHGIVRGRVLVSEVQGDGRPSPDPDPPVRVDDTAPELTDLRVERRTLRFTLDEAATVAVRIDRRVGRRWRRAGGRRLRGHVGWNAALLPRTVRRPGRFRLVARATDPAGNRTVAVRVGFRLR